MQVISYGGLSILNAIPLGLGSTCAVDLKVEVTARFGRMDTGSSLVRTILDYFRQKSDKEISLEIRSEIPSAGGLKSSSAVAVAAISSIASLLGEEINVPLLAARLSIESGTSVTGALDDATASFYGGVSVCDNARMKILRKKEQFPEGMAFVILPRGSRVDFNPEILRSSWPSFKAITGMVMAGNYLEAMKQNGLTVSRILGYETGLLLKAIELGAGASGVSGNGPSLFAAVNEGEEGPILDLFSTLGKPVLKRAV